MHPRHANNLKVLILIVFIVILFGTLGFMVLENLHFVDALLRTLLVFSTLGFSEASAQTVWGKWYTILLILTGLGVIVYAASTFFQAALEGEITGTWKKNMLTKKLAHLEDHIIICGFGRVGRQVAEEVAAEDIPLVIVDQVDKSEECAAKGYLFVQGDASGSDDTLQKVRLERARALIIAIGNDSEALATTVTARALNKEVFLVARATSKAAEGRLLSVGVNRVAMPAFIGGYHMATMALRPTVVDFLDLLIDSKRDELQIEELVIATDSKLVGEKINIAFNSRKNGVVGLAVYRKGSKRCIRPKADTIIEEGDRLILMGTLHQLDTLMDKVE